MNGAKDDIIDISELSPAPASLISAPAPSASAVIVPSDDEIRAVLAQAPADATPESARAALIAANGDLGGAIGALWNVDAGGLTAAPTAPARTAEQQHWDRIRTTSDAMARLRNAYGVPRGGIHPPSI